MIAATIPPGTQLAYGTVTASELVTSPDGRELLRLTVRYHDGSEGPRVFGLGDDLPVVVPASSLRGPAYVTHLGVRDGRLVVVA